MAAILDRTHRITLEEEVSYGSPPATRLDAAMAIPTWFSIAPIALNVNETPTIIDIDSADGTRAPGRSETVAKVIDWSMTLMIHPETYLAFVKWATGTLLAVNPTNGVYRATLPTPPTVNTLDSFTMYVDVQNEEYFGAGSQVIALLGCTIGRLGIAGAADEAGRKMLMTLEGLAQMPMVTTGATIVVLDYADVDTQDDTITFVVNGVTTTITEDVEFQSITSNTVAATNITTAINAITGLNATSSTATVTVTAQAGYTIEEIRTSAKQVSMTADLTMGDVLQGTSALRYVRRLLYNNVNPESFLFSGVSSQWDAGGYLASNKWQSVGIDIVNNLIPRKYAESSQSPYIDEIRLGGQSVTIVTDKDYADMASRLHDFRNSTERALDIRAVHQQDRLSDGQKYTNIWTFPRLTIIDANPIIAAGGGDEERVNTIAMRALVDHQVVDATHTPSVSVGDLAMDIDTAFVSGSSGDVEAFEFTTTNAGYLSQIRVKLKTTATAGNMPETADIYMDIWTDDGGGTSEPNAAVVGGTSSKVSGEILTETYQHIYFTFPNRPKLDAATVYWFLIYTTAGGTLTINIEKDAAGTATHTGSHDGGQNWNQPLPDTDEAGFEIYMDDVQAVLEGYVKTSATTLYPDPS